MGSLKRPLAVVGFSMLLTVLCITLTDCTTLAVFAVALSGICLVLSVALRFKGYDTLVAISVGIILSSLFILNAQLSHDKAITMCGENRYVEAVVSSEAEYSEKRGRYYVETTVKSIDGEKTGGKMRLSLPGTDGGEHNELRIGDRICFVANVYMTGSDSEEVHDSFISEKIYLGAYSVKLVDKTEPKIRGPFYYASAVRNKISDIFRESFSVEISGVLTALLTGDKSDCTDDVYRAFKRSGAAHIMAVSGMHLSIWLSLLWIIGKNNEKRRKLYFILGVVIVVLFVFIADFSQSVCRAALMSSLYLFGTLLNKKAESLNSMGFALICILCTNPFAVHSISFQLSFACVFSIIAVAVPLIEVFEPKIKKAVKDKRLSRILLYAVSCIISSVSITVMTFPISSYHFGYVSLISPVTNLFIIPVCAPVMVSSVLYLAFSRVPYLSVLLRIITEILGRYMLNVTRDFSSLAFSTVVTDMREKLLWLVPAAVLLIMYLLKRSNRKRMMKFISVLTVMLTAFSLLSIADKRADECRIKLINTESGSAAVLIYNGKGILLGTASDYYFYDMLSDVIEAENVKLVAAVPIEASDNGELGYICKDFSIENIISPGERTVLFGKVYVHSTENGAEIELNGKRIGIFSSCYLQVDETYDIMIRNDGEIIAENGDSVICEKQGHSATVYISEKNGIKIRREELWPNLMKKS